MAFYRGEILFGLLYIPSLGKIIRIPHALISLIFWWSDISWTLWSHHNVGVAKDYLKTLRSLDKYGINDAQLLPIAQAGKHLGWYIKSTNDAMHSSYAWMLVIKNNEIFFKMTILDNYVHI